MKQQWRVMGGGHSVVWMRWWQWWGCAFANARWERGLGAKNHETEHDGLAWMSWQWQCSLVFDNSRGEGGRGQKSKTKP
jgi:hypothetical protein